MKTGLPRPLLISKDTDNETTNRGFPTRMAYLNSGRVLTYLYPSLPVEHRPSMTPRHRILFWAALVILDQLVPCCFSSASVSRLQLLRGRPLFLFPCGFQVRAWRMVLDAGFLGVCPIQPHFLCRICLATGSCPARSHRSSFRNVLGIRRGVSLAASFRLSLHCVISLLDGDPSLRR